MKIPEIYQVFYSGLNKAILKAIIPPLQLILDVYMKNTGERVLPKKDNGLFDAGKKRYGFALNIIAELKNPTLLDIACGTGYGTKILSVLSKNLVGVDVDKETITFCKNTYKDVDFMLIKSADIEIPEFVNKFDAVTSFETIEHVKDPLTMLRNLKKYLKEDGVLILSTPNNIYKKYPPANPFHTYEFKTKELYDILRGVFQNSDIKTYGQAQTSSRKSDPRIKEGIITKLIRNMYGIIFKLDKKTFHILEKLNNTKIYKKFSKLQKSYETNNDVYEINLSTDYFIPEINIFVVKV